MSEQVNTEAAGEAGHALRWLHTALKGNFLHPQWLSDRFHARSRRRLRDLHDSTVLDIGSGDSDTAQLLGSGNRLIRLDYPTTNRRYRFAPQLFADAARLPLADAVVDAVLLLEVLEHVTDAEAALSEAARVLRPGGRLYLSVPMMYPIHDAPHDYRRYTIHGLRRLLKASSLLPTAQAQHGNSWVAALQMLNLAGLEWVMNMYARALLFGVGALMLVYPLCLLCNTLALPLLFGKGPSRACLGYFIEARRQ